jgi:AraC-like DNA-binding protein
MLKERIIYRDNMPVNLLVADIENYPIHFHDDLEVVFVLKGEVLLRNGYYNYNLKPGDIFILNDREIHSFTRIDDEPNMVMIFQLDLTYFSRYYENLKNNFFVTDMEDDDDESLDVLRRLLGRILLDILGKGSRYHEKVLEGTHNLIATLQAEFHYFVMEDGKFVNETRNKANKILAARLARITDFMYDNYFRKLTLAEIAHREHLSIYYLSHVIKEATGLSFQELLNFIRVEESEKLLLGTNKRIGTIAEESGFSALRYYVKHFETWFHMHPAQYRKEFTGRVSSRESQAVLRRCDPEEIEEALRDLVPGLAGSLYSGGAQGPVLLHLGKDALWEEPAGEVLPDRFFNLPVLAPVSGLYHTVLALDERRMAASGSYLVTGRGTHHGGLESASVLFLNGDEDLLSALAGAASPGEAAALLPEWDKESEFLLQWEGLEGEYQVLRYRMTMDNCICALHGSDRLTGRHGARRSLLNLLGALPAVESDTLEATDTLSLRATLRGFSWELILIDKKTAT